MTTSTLFTKENIRKVEAWIVSLIFGFFIFTLLIKSQGDHTYIPWHFREYHIQFSYLENKFLPILVFGATAYASIMVALLVVEPFWDREKSVLKTLGLIASILFSAWLVVAIAETYSDAWKFGKYETVEIAYRQIFFTAFTHCTIFALVYLAYYLTKQGISLVSNWVNWNRPSISQGGFKLLTMVFLWFVILIFLASLGAVHGLVSIWGILVPYSAIIIAINRYRLIPSAKTGKFTDSGYLVKLVFVVTCLDILASVLFAGAIGMRTEEIIILFFLILMWTAVALIPWSWYLYKNASDKSVLTSALGKSDASLSFLKSQINPHFLFNALNTLYGTALQEQAERTGEGIQKLGDMMRFMLHENTQNKISLTRDVDYLKNYIDLQKLRTSRSADILIETQIEEQLGSLEIAPMLLIPFVENAFKHGISLQEPSHIKVTLQSRDRILYFDVHNSIHLKADNDPEKLKSGIGLQNVKQRLALLYPRKHELIIRESAKEFFIHLTLNLD